MSKRARRPVGFYPSCLKGDPDAIFRKKYRPTSKPRVMGFLRWNASLQKGCAATMQSSSSSGRTVAGRRTHGSPPNTHWPTSSLTSEQVSQPTSPRRMLREAGTSVWGGIETSLRVLRDAHNEPRCYPVPVSQNTIRSLWQSVPGGWRGACGGGAGIFCEKVLNCDRAARRVNTLVTVKLFIGRSLQFLDKHSQKTARRPVEKVQVTFTKSCFTGTEDWNPRSIKRLL